MTQQEIINDGVILEIELNVTRMDGKYKLSQNRSLEDKQGVISNLTKSSCSMDQQVAALMKKLLAPAD